VNEAEAEREFRRACPEMQVEGRNSLAPRPRRGSEVEGIGNGVCWYTVIRNCLIVLAICSN